MHYIHQLNPVMLSIGPLNLRWYGMAYLLGILIGWKILTKMSQRLLNQKQIESLVNHNICAIMIGGRVGYCLFYNSIYYAANPIEILKIWHGGMSFHGALLAMIIANFHFARKHQINFWVLTDLIVYAAPIGIFFGRIANFINGELVGRACENAFCVIFPKYDLIPRYPSQLYEAIGEGLCLGLLLYLIKDRVTLPGIKSAIFLCYYGAIRLLLEQFREPDIQIGLLSFGFTMGQYLSLMMLMVGLIMIAYIHRNKKSSYGL